MIHRPLLISINDYYFKTGSQDNWIDFNFLVLSILQMGFKSTMEKIHIFMIIFRVTLSILNLVHSGLDTFKCLK